MPDAIDKGYLLENFRLFHLRDQRAQRVEPHYHSFDKLVLLCAGAVDYTIEGVCYRMQPGDLLFVRHHDIHRPVISPERVYERIVLWISPEFLAQCSLPGEPLDRCFDLTSAQRRCLCRPDGETSLQLRRLAAALERAVQEERAFGRETLVNACFLQLMVACGRCALQAQSAASGNLDPKIGAAINYIHLHLSEPLPVEQLAGMCFMSRCYFMRRFKEATGYTVHGYILQKRLAAATARLEEGAPVTAAALECGCSDYSAVLRAFRRAYGTAPRDYLRNRMGLNSEFPE